MPRPWPSSSQLLLATALLLLLAACQRDSEPSRTASPQPAAQENPQAQESAPETPPGPPPEEYALLPPGAFEDAAAPADGVPPAAEGEAGAQALPDKGQLPTAGQLNLTGVRLGMGSTEIYARYPADSGWVYDKRFVEPGETGLLLAKPRDAKARASEMIMLHDGQTAAFLRAVKEDDASYRATVQQLAQDYGKPLESPPQWAQQYEIFRDWRSNANETGRFWADAQKRFVLAAGRNMEDGETVYMLLDLPGMQLVQQAIAAAGQPAPAKPDTSWLPEPPGETTP